MKKILSLAVVVTFLGSLLVAPAFGAVKAGATCTKAGITSIVSGKKYTCIKLGKKLVWDKGAQIVGTTLAGSQPLPVSSNTNAETRFIIPAEPTRFQDLDSNLEGIQYWAWKKIRSNLEEGTPNLGAVKTFTGPNTVPTQPDPEFWFRQTSKVFGSFSQVKQIYVIQFELEDLAWAQQQYQLLQDQTWRSDYLTKTAQQCPDSRCRNASAELNSKGEAIILVGEISSVKQSADKAENPGRYNGTQQSHEYLHTIQMLNTPDFSYSMLPAWLLEGEAMGTAQAISANTYSEYKDLRKIDYPELSTMNPSYTPDWISNFLNPNPIFIKNTDNWSYWRQFPNYRIYDIGALTNEILTSLKGPASVMNLYVAVGKGETFASAFKSEFGLSWADALPYIAKAIAAELKQMSSK